jgi:hypothetical protein
MDTDRIDIGHGLKAALRLSEGFPGLVEASLDNNGCTMKLESSFVGEAAARERLRTKPDTGLEA